MLSFADATFHYEPYPIGATPAAFTAELYEELAETFPPVELFEFKASLGNKYSLSELNNPHLYHRYVAASPVWRRFHRYVKAPTFPGAVLAMLKEHNVDLGISDAQRSWMGSMAGRLPGRRSPRLSARFEFSMLPAAGGFIKPHTDSPQKIVTLVVSMSTPGEWDPTHGGGTEVLRPKNTRENFNFLNRYLQFTDVETLRTYAYQPNQCVIFVKTFNSLHGVRPMSGHGSAAMRKTLTINIELR